MLEEAYEPIMQSQHKLSDLWNSKESSYKNFNLRNVVTACKEVFGHVEQANDKEIIVALGNAGCGKSTMFTSLVYGPQSLERKKVEYEFEIPTSDGKTKLKKKTQFHLEQSSDHKYMLKSQGLPNQFKVRHDHKQESFVPHLAIEGDKIYADLPGMSPQNTDIALCINNFVIKMLFAYGRNVRFIVPITQAQLEENKGTEIMETIQQILNISTNNSTLIESVQPVLLRCKQQQEDGIDLDIAKHYLKNIIDQQIDPKIKDRVEMVAAEGELTENLEKSAQLVAMMARKEFLMKFASKLIIFDPMDRPIPNLEENCATSVTKFKQIIDNMQPSTDIVCNVPMSNELHEKIQNQIQEENKACIAITESYVRNAKTHGPQFIQDLSENEQIKELMECLEFLAKYRLVPQVDEKFALFNDFILANTRIIESAQSYDKLDDLQKFQFDQFSKMNHTFESGKTTQLLKTLIKTQDKIDELDKKHSKSDSEQQLVQITQMRQEIVYILNNFVEDPHQFFLFAFELRKYDGIKRNKDYYTNKFLEMEEVEIPQIWKDIVYSNKCFKLPGESENKMLVDKCIRFKMNCGSQNHKYSLRYNYYDSDTVQVEGFKPNNTFDCNGKAFIDVPMKPSKYQKIEGQYRSASFQFILTKHGLVIGRDFKIGQKICQTRLMANGEVTLDNNQFMEWGDTAHPQWNNPKCYVFTLNPSDKEGCFTVQLPYGFKQARLMPSIKNPQTFSWLEASSQQTEDYFDEEQVLWKITKVVDTQ